LTPPCEEDGPRGCRWIDLYQSPFIDVSRTTMENYYQNPLDRFFLGDTVKS
jgi:peptide/nickel transport system substrate-binding protein